MLIILKQIALFYFSQQNDPASGHLILKKVTQLVKQNVHPRQMNVVPIQPSATNNSIDLTDEDETTSRPQTSNPPALVAMNNQTAKQNLNNSLKQTSNNTLSYILKPANEAGKQITVSRVQQQQPQFRSQFSTFSNK